jgi:glutathione S-transferase
MIILHYDRDNASLIVRLALLELGLDHVAQRVNRKVNAHTSPDYLALAPTGLIPAIVDGDKTLFETGAILLYLADKTGRMFPPPQHPLRGDALKWLFFLSNTLHADCRLAFYADRYAGQSPAPAPFMDAVRARLMRHLGLMNSAALRQPELFWQDGPTILALYLVVLRRWLQLYPRSHAPLANMTDWSAVLDLAARCEARPSAHTAAEAEGLGPTIFTAPHYPITAKPTA